MKEEVRTIIRSEAVWPQMWSDLMKNAQTSAPLPQIDFRTQMVLVASLGSLEYGGPGIQLDLVAEYPELVVMHLSVWRGKDCESPEWDHRPVTVVKMPNTYKPIIFVDTPKARMKCGCDFTRAQQQLA
jgi:hypothetical protein